MKGNGKLERKRILFQGDSITDAGRNRTNPTANTGLGDGFVTMIAGELGCKYPHVDVLNRGAGGDRIGDLYRRWLEDMRNIDFDMISILIGVNDVGNELRLGKGSDTERFAFIFERMLEEVRQSHPGAKIVLCQSFLLRRDLAQTGREHPIFGNDIYENYDHWAELLAEQTPVIRELAEKYDAIYVPFWEALKAVDMPAEDLTPDGGHMTARGNYILAQAWIHAVENYIRENWTD